MRLCAIASLLCGGLTSCQPEPFTTSFVDEDGGPAGGGPGPPPVEIPPSAQASQVRINEVMVKNRATLADETGAFPSWVELFNPAEAPADLSGVFLSDDTLAPGKWALPAGPESVVPPRGYIVIFCDGGASGLHAPFILKAGPLGIVLNKGSDLFFADGSALGPDQSEGRSPDGGETISVLSAPTPGTANAEPLPERRGIRGDVDRDGALDLTDAIDMLDFLFLGDFTPYCTPVADADADGTLGIGDLTAILAFLFQGGAPLPGLSAQELAECGGNRNEPPAVPPRPVYHTFSGYPAEVRIEAADPEGGHLTYQAVDLPPGASLEEDTGLVRWTPSGEQLGPSYLSFAVMDDADPPNWAGGLLVFQVHPLEACIRPDCDPARGCEWSLAPIGEACCGGPGPRVSEPEVGCPAGRVLHVGRNPAGSPSIGRLVNCDLLRLVPLGQGGYVARLNLEARCLVPEQVLLEVRLETAEAVLIDETGRLDLEPRADGFFQLLALRFVAEGSFAKGEAADLTVVATDSDGTRLERKLRVVLTRDAVPDLP